MQRKKQRPLNASSVSVFAAFAGGWAIGRTIDVLFLTDYQREIIGLTVYDLIHGNPFENAYNFYKDLLFKKRSNCESGK